MKNIRRVTCFVALISVLFAGSVFAERLSVSTGSANVRSGPGAKYEILWENIDKYYPLLVLEKQDSWFYVRDYENDVGWIHKSYVNNTESVITKKNGCNIRSGPGTKYSIVFVVDNGIPFKVIERKEQWIQIKHSDGDKGWVHQKLVW